ncbi:hypothetical protein GCM10009001_02650 [Virgibacillus siamensis]|uniref:Uncharacterized protein n=1 Tax=Virgibacillus siamensis TaxID=480071 RepID=A0ABN1FG95_9BACI
MAVTAVRTVMHRLTLGAPSIIIFILADKKLSLMYNGNAGYVSGFSKKETSYMSSLLALNAVCII